ncbi:MAG: TonB-dependent receptor [Acidobacteriia bacterium]|nr:TonB-dependent receptor [Terriglobia bacterium]
MRVTLKSLLLAVLLTTAVSLAGVRAYGQGGATGAISGTVLDASGGAIADAEVQIIDTRTDAVARKLTTSTDGAFVATLLPPGDYRVVVNKAGFAEARAASIEVRVTETTRVSITLKPGAVTEKVEISATVATVETTNATTGQSIGSSTVRQLPLATQNYQQLLSLSTGAQSELNGSAQLGRGNVRIIVNGQREDNNNYLIEGISATDYNVAQSTNVPLPNPDVIQEFKVQTSLYDASQGRNGGGNVNAILRSGTKELHGDVYEFFRNDVLNANEFFQNRAAQQRPPVKQNIFGGSLGGPVGTEKFGFFFVNYQGTRQRSGLSPGTSISSVIPALPANRTAANLSQVFFGNPNVALDPVTVALLNFKSNQFGGDANGYLIPSLPADPVLSASSPYPLARFVISKPGKYTDDQFTTNWDREFRAGQDKISARFFFSNAESLLPFGAGGLQASLGGTLASSISSTDLNFPYDLPVNARFFGLTETHLFSPTLVNEFRFGFVRINNSLINVPPVTATDLGINRPTNSVTQSIYKFTLGSSGFQIGPTPPADQFQTQNNFNFVDNFSWVRGAHIFRFGGDYTRVNLDKLFPQVFNGQLFFVNGGGLTDFQKLLIGAPDFSFGGGGVYNHQYRSNNYGVYGQDDWKATRDLTLNLGLRVELMGAFHDNLCHIGNIDSDLSQQGKYPFLYPSCVKGLNIPGLSPTASDTTFDNTYSTGIGPRIGLAYDLFGRHKTTIRAGYGIYYVREDVGTVDQLSFQAPFLPVAFLGGPAGSLANFFLTPPNNLPQAGTIDPTFVGCQSVFLGFPGGDTNQFPNFSSAPGCNGVAAFNIFALQVPRHFVLPNTQQWNLTIQRALGKEWVLEVGYIGTKGTHLRETRTSLQARLASPQNPIVIQGASCDGSVVGPSASCSVTTNTISNGAARSRGFGINGYNGMQLFADDAYSHYHSLQTTVSRRWSAGYFQAAYTFSRSTDATSSGNTALNTAFNDESSLDASRGLSDFDRTHRLAVSYRYDLPFFSSAEGWKHSLLSGWAVSGITIFQSGAPFSVTDSGAGTAFIGPGFTPATLGASLAPGGSIAAGQTSGDIHNRLDGYLNSSNFAPASLLYPQQCDPVNFPLQYDPNFCTTNFGSLGRNIYRGPRQQNWDFSLIKNFKITERNSIRFTADFFNIWNHANFSNPAQNDVENPAAFGKIISTVGTPRLIQFSLRWAF